MEYQADLEQLEAKYRAHPKGNIIFYGSSSIRMWPGLGRTFPGLTIENWGFGGSTLAECAQVFERFIVPRAPRALVIFAGDNDLAKGASPVEVWEALRALMDAREAKLGAIETAVLSLKVSPARIELRAQIEEANRWCQREIWAREAAQWVDIVAPMLDETGAPRHELFANDGLHLSRAGYDVWNQYLQRENSWLSA